MAWEKQDRIAATHCNLFWMAIFNFLNLKSTNQGTNSLLYSNTTLTESTVTQSKSVFWDPVPLRGEQGRTGGGMHPTSRQPCDWVPGCGAPAIHFPSAQEVPLRLKGRWLSQALFSLAWFKPTTPLPPKQWNTKLAFPCLASPSDPPYPPAPLSGLVKPPVSTWTLLCNVKRSSASTLPTHMPPFLPNSPNLELIHNKYPCKLWVLLPVNFYRTSVWYQTIRRSCILPKTARPPSTETILISLALLQ